MFVKSYFCIRPVLLRRQYDIDAASLFGQILHKSNYNLNITRCLIRLSAAYPKNFFFSYLRGFCSIHRRCYGNAVNFFMKNHTVNDVPTDLCLYVGSCYLMQSKKRTCPNKEKIKLIGNTFIRKYRRRKHKNAMSTLNLAETLLFQGRKAEAFCMFEKVLRSKG
ncbi:hypothetical protein MHBO_005103 [Bonamia ostreae]|uniref:Uncharacterized protein n=1 Tax=Bonamia ostreae TaxID=126728 RepID=A0ABV2AVP7_9EUKA